MIRSGMAAATPENVSVVGSSEVVAGLGLKKTPGVPGDNMEVRMRKVLLASAALGAVTAYFASSSARADDPVFPVTTETALAGFNGNQFAGAAPGSVQVNLGGRLYSSMWFQSNPSGTNSLTKFTQPTLGNFLFLYPSFDYTSPAGIHFGVSAEIRDNQAQFGNNTNSTLYAYQAIGYVSSDRFGRFQFGTPNGSVTNLAVGTGDDFGTGDFFAYYGTTPYVPWVMGDSYDNYVPMQKLTYTTPTWAGFKAEISWQPSAVSLTDSYSQTNGSGGVTAIMPTPGLLSRNRVELAGQYVGNFGPVSLKANGGWVVANPSPTDGLSIAGQNVSFGNAGIEVHVAGLEVESSVVSGKYSYATTDNGNPMGPLPEGAKGTTAWIAGVGYSIGPLKAGVMYYGVYYDQMDFNPGGPSQAGRVSGVGLGATYTVGPGVSVSLDAITATIQEQPTTANGFLKDKQTVDGIGLSTFFTW
jgi:hypothetical protein